jgi:hypothetical protein
MSDVKVRKFQSLEKCPRRNSKSWKFSGRRYTARMKTILRVSILLAVFAGYTLAQDETTLAASGHITALGTNTPRSLVADVKISGGSTSKTFAVSENCKFMTAGIGVYGELKKGNNVMIEYIEKEGGTNLATQVTVQSAAPAQPAKTTAPAPKPPAKKPQKKKK